MNVYEVRYRNLSNEQESSEDAIVVAETVTDAITFAQEELTGADQEVTNVLLKEDGVWMA